MKASDCETQPETRTSKSRERYADELVNRLSPINLPTGEAYLRAKRASGVRPGTAINCISAIATLDRDVGGQDFRTLTPADLSSALEIFSRTHTPNSARVHAAHLRMFYGWLNEDVCPPAIRRALKRVKCAELKDVTPLTRDEFDAILFGANDPDADPSEVHRRMALLWVLWDSGFRISEALSLRVGNVQPDEQGALLTLPPDGMDLKTGPRSVYVIDCWGAIRCWLMLHPRGNDRTAPLFCSFANPARTIHSSEAQKMVKRVCKRTVVRIGQNGESEVHPHLFRHTRATRAAENGWMEAELRAYFGWSARSPMPAHYVHLAKRHMTQKIKDEANLDPILKRVQTDPRAALAEASAAGGVAAAREMLDALGLLPATRTSRPEERAR